MLDQITIQYPTWYILLCLGLGLLLASLLYYKSDKFTEEGKWIKPSLFLLRFVAISGIAFFLLSPLLQSAKDNTQDPIIILAKDISESIEKSSGPNNVSDIHTSLSALNEKLAEKYQVESLSFGAITSTGLQDSFNAKVTNLSGTINYIEENYADQNVGAIIIASDGIYNEGTNPLYAASNIITPIYTIALGDTVQKTDLFISNIFANEIVYLNDRFSMQIDLQAYNSRGTSSRLRVTKLSETGNTEVFNKAIRIDESDFFITEEIILDASEAGINRYRVSLAPIRDEISTTNNYKTAYIQVLDARQKLLVLAQAPHPDLSAISQLISENKNYEVEIAIKGKDSYSIQEYDQVIFHNLPGRGQNIRAELSTLKKNKVPHLFIVGAQMDIAGFNRSQEILSIRGNGQTTEEIEPTFNDGFRSFTTSEELKSGLKTFPPLIAPFGEYNLTTTATSLLFQNIRNVETRYPLVSFQEKEGVQTGIIIGEGIWKWRLFDFLQNGNYELTGEFLSKIIQYISKKKDNRKFIVKASSNLYKENQQIFFTGQLYNDNYEAVNEPEVFLSVFGSNDQEYPYIFNRTKEAYSLDIGLLPVGSYNFNARTTYNSQEYTDRGRFTVQEIELESFDLEARHQVLKSLSDNTGGQMYDLKDINELADIILEKDNIKPIVYQNIQNNPLINIKWLFPILLLLLTIEWVIRRYYGSF